MFVEKSEGVDTGMAARRDKTRSVAEVATPRRTMGGLLLRKECWVLSRWGKLLMLLAILASGTALLYGVYPFLAVTQPIPAKLLVMEGWMPAHLAGQVAHQYESGRFEKVLLVRGLRETGDPYESGEFWAKYMANRLVELGIPKDRVEVVFFEESNTDRTYQSALAAKNWLAEHGGETRAINVATLGPHARRSRLLFEMAFDKQWDVGVIALNQPMYDIDHWWRSSAGVREVASELLAYLYARFFFSPHCHAGSALVRRFPARPTSAQDVVVPRRPAPPIEPTFHPAIAA